MVNNSLGSVTSSVIQLDVNGSLTEGLVGWWKFNEVDGNISYDSSGNGNDGNLTNGPTWVDGKIGGALSFDGIDDYMITPNFEGIGGTAPRSITAWIKTTDLDGIICSYGNNQSGQRWTLRVSEPNGTIRTEIENGYKKGINPVNNGQWTLVSSILHPGSDNISDVVHYVNGNFENYSDLTPLLLDTNLSSKFTVGARLGTDLSLIHI